MMAVGFHGSQLGSDTLSMKRKITLSLAVLLSGCAQPLIGDGDLVEVERPLAEVDGVESYGINVELQQGKSWELVVAGDANLLAHVHTVVEDGILRIDTDAAMFPTELTVSVVVPQLRWVGGFDGADIRAVDVDSPSLSVESSGAGHIELIGEVDVLTIFSSGSGVHNAAELTAEEVSVTSTGSGVSWLTVTDTIEGEISSAVTLNVFGDPVRKAVVAHDTSEVIYY